MPMEDQVNFKSISQLAKKFDFATEAAIRSQIANAENNGLTESGAILRRGNRILIDEDRWLEWFTSREKAA